MIHSIRVHRVAPQFNRIFVAGFRQGGFCHKILRSFPGYIATDLRQSMALPDAFIEISFFVSEIACRTAKRSTRFQTIEDFLTRLTATSTDLGEFCSPDDSEARVEPNAELVEFVNRQPKFKG